MSTASNIEKHDLSLPNKADAGQLAFILLNVFTPEECQQWIEMAENLKSHRNP
jgi:linoleoyl-CoA desaturase